MPDPLLTHAEAEKFLGALKDWPELVKDYPTSVPASQVIDLLSKALEYKDDESISASAIKAKLQEAVHAYPESAKMVQEENQQIIKVLGKNGEFFVELNKDISNAFAAPLTSSEATHHEPLTPLPTGKSPASVKQK